MNRSTDSRLEDQLGPEEPSYKSRGEAQVGRLLDRYGIPFVYEQPRVVAARGKSSIWRPDFTLPGFDDLVVEYAGMPDRPEYMAGVRFKQEAFEANGIPAMFVYPGDLSGPNWPQRLYGRIDRYGQSILRATAYAHERRARCSYQ